MGCILRRWCMLLCLEGGCDEEVVFGGVGGCWCSVISKAEAGLFLGYF